MLLLLVGEASQRNDRGLATAALLWLDGLAFGDMLTLGACKEGRDEVFSVGSLKGEGLRMARGIGIDVEAIEGNRDVVLLETFARCKLIATHSWKCPGKIKLTPVKNS